MSNNYLPDYLTIPCILINDKRMRPIDHLVYGLVYWYSKLKLEKCVASNGTIAELLSTHQSTIANSIGRLNKFGYVRILYDENVSNNNRVRTEIIPLIVFSEVSPNGEGGYRQKAKRVSPKSETGVSPYGEHNKNIDKKEYIASTHIPLSLLNEDATQEQPAPHSKKLQVDDLAKRLFSLWRTHKALIPHRVLSQKMIGKVSARSEDGYSEVELNCAIDNYALVLDSPDFFLEYRWTFDQFMEPRNLDKFIDIDMAKKSYGTNKRGGVASVG